MLDIRVRLIPTKVVDAIPSEDHLLGHNPKDALYEIRVLKALATYGDTPFIATLFNDSDQVYIDEFEVWAAPGTWEYVKEGTTNSLEANLTQAELATNGHTWRHIWNIQRFMLRGWMADSHTIGALPQIIQQVVQESLTGCRDILSKTSRHAFDSCSALKTIELNTREYVRGPLRQYFHDLPRKYDNLALAEIHRRCLTHDQSKLVNPELGTFVEFTPKLKGVKFGSDEYKSFLEGMKPALENHYSNNKHHPEYYPNGYLGMTFFDLYEMMCDWSASSMRTAEGSFEQSLEICSKRFGIDQAVADLLMYTFSNCIQPEYEISQGFYYSQTLVTELGTWCVNSNGHDGQPGPVGCNSVIDKDGAPGPEGANLDINESTDHRKHDDDQGDSSLLGDQG